MVDDALRQLFMPGSSGRIDNQRYYYLQREYEGGENGGRGEQGYMTRQMYRGRDDTQERISNSTLYRGAMFPGMLVESMIMAAARNLMTVAGAASAGIMNMNTIADQVRLW